MKILIPAGTNERRKQAWNAQPGTRGQPECRKSGFTPRGGQVHDGSLRGGERYRACGTTSRFRPESLANLIGNSALLVTTPGIGTVNEAMNREIPIVLLPPMNSTQLAHYQVLTHHGLAGVLEPDLARRMSQVAKSIPWRQQARFCLQLWSEQTARLLMPMPRVFGDLLNMEILEGRNRALSAQRGSSRA